MLRSLFAVAIIILAANAVSTAQELKSGPEPDELLPGAFQALNINGPFAGRAHALVTEFRLNPVCMVFVRAQPDVVDAEATKLLQALDKITDERYADTGLRVCVIFLSPNARSGATEDTKETKASPEQAKALIEETVNREKLVAGLKEFSKPFKRLIVACCPAESVDQQYRLAVKAEVTVVVYAQLRVFSNFAFAEGQLKQEGTDRVMAAIDAMLSKLKKTPSH